MWRHTVGNSITNLHEGSADVMINYLLNQDKSRIDNLEELVKIIKEKSSGVTSLRIKVSKGDDITDKQSENLMAASLQFPNVVLYKEAKTEVHRNTEEEKKEMEERRKRISEYDGLTFEQITKKYAKEVFGKTVTDEQIQEILSS